MLGMIFSMCALMMRIKWCAWVALYCSCISFANTKLNDDTKQIMSSFMCVAKRDFELQLKTDFLLPLLFRLSISAVVMSYLQNPTPMTLPGMS